MPVRGKDALEELRKMEQASGLSNLHPLWLELIKYVTENGGHVKMNIRFKDGLPVEAEEIKKKVRFDLR